MCEKQFNENLYFYYELLMKIYGEKFRLWMHAQRVDSISVLGPFEMKNAID